MAARAEVWVTCRAIIEIPCGPYYLRTSFEQLSKSAESEAKAKLTCALSGSRLAAKGQLTVIGYRADLEGALQMKPSPLSELERRSAQEFTDASKACGLVDTTGTHTCELSQGHAGPHEHSKVTWR